MTTISHWLRDAERVRFRTRRVSGGRVVVALGALPRGAYLVAVDTTAPGHGTFARCLDERRPFANRHNALLGGLIAIREHWRREQIPAMVADVDELINDVF